MVYGVGVDIVDIERMKKSLQSEAFFTRVFSKAEQAALLAVKGKKRTESAAACFAAKEAFLKAAGTGLSGFPLHEVGVLRQLSGAPYYDLCGTAAAFAKENKLTAHLSLTHDAGVAAAFAVLERG